MSFTPDALKACLDVHYSQDMATAAAVTFSDWQAQEPEGEFTISMPVSGDYVPGQFYRRELPPVLKLLETLPQLPAVLIIDGFVWLAPGRPGLGAHLYESLNREVPIIGVAKTPFRDNTVSVEIHRGRSTRPLHITSEGIATDAAAEFIRTMAGPHRFPLLIKKADLLSRTGN